MKLRGATAHFVTDALDEGPILTQQIIPVDHTFNVVEMMKAGKEVELWVLAKAVRLVCEDRVFIHGNKTVIFELKKSRSHTETALVFQTDFAIKGRITP